MARILIVEDDPDQLEIRKILVERSGHKVISAKSSAEAMESLKNPPAAAIVDLSLPTLEDGLALIADIHHTSPQTKIAVLTGRSEALHDRPEAAYAAAVLDKPCPTRKLLDTLARLVVCLLALITPVAAREFRFDADGKGEMIAELDLKSPGSDFAVASRAAAVANLRVDGGEPQHVIVLGERRDRYSVFLGRLTSGPHTLAIERDAQFSAPESRLEISGAKFHEDDSEFAANAPVMFARADTVGTFSDIPLLVYAEREPFQYTVIFSHEDGGTSTRGLMARWGRTTDIEHVYRRDGETWFIQTRDHKDVPYTGPYEGKHPLLIPVTQNNMVEPGRGVLRFQFVPQVIDLRDNSREIVMDRAPWTYAVAAKELMRQDRLKEIGDPRNYVYLEAKILNRDSCIAFRARLTTETTWRRSDDGDARIAIERNGWVRSTILLPAGTSPRQIAEFGIECMRDPHAPEGSKPECKLEELLPAFFLTPDYMPGRTFRLPRKQ